MLGITAIKLSKKAPSPEGEGWVRGNILVDSPHPNLLQQERAFVLS
ncbi:hypothetical protein CRENPOLYSF2_830009 [Crenothrix polyspora]|uniref:Uncharacterized protein n=1 Tax=Crenothrix polyspora TaxID=360316 RepID=A0A1R4HJG2_9GAMM|nr:hypothetical protein CRENPOLYSF2_830009 [Crenothrix polyspora]